MFQQSVSFIRRPSTFRISAGKNLAVWRQSHLHVTAQAAICCSFAHPIRQPTNSRNFASTAVEQGQGITVARSHGKQTGYCYGCGADLVKGTTGNMATAPKKTGYWAEKQQTIKISKLKNWALCPRCRKLKNAAKSGDDSVIDALGPDSRMMEVFRKEVGKLRAKQNIVVVLCVDAVNVAGTLIRTIRNYVGGNPILLAITRCDLLPGFVWDAKSVTEMKEVYAERAVEIQPADVYLCSEEKEFISTLPGIRELASDLWEHLNQRDVYVVGAANIGKSTLTDALIQYFIYRGEREGHFSDRLAKKRVEKLKESRITKSALPGTTLQNIRVPCFDDHTRALWDTPGLLLDVSLSHFPIRDFRRIRASRPTKIEASVLEVSQKSFALLVCEKEDETPLLRVEVRLSKKGEGEGLVRLVWNSTLPLVTKIVDIESACKDEDERVKQLEMIQPQQTQQSEETPQTDPKLTPEERAARKAERRRFFEERVRKEQEELGKKEWHAKQAKEKAEALELKRAKTLAKLSIVDEAIVDGGVGMDLEIANFGWIGILPPRTAMVKTFAPSRGVKILQTPAIALPPEWGEYKSPPKKEKEPKSSQNENSDDMESTDPIEGYSDLWDDDDAEYSEYGLPEDDWDDAPFDEHEFLADGRHDGFDYGGNEGYRPHNRGSSNRDIRTNSKPDPWEKCSGEHVGWQFDADTRWSRRGKFEGWNPIRPKEEQPHLQLP